MTTRRVFQGQVYDPGGVPDVRQGGVAMALFGRLKRQKKAGKDRAFVEAEVDSEYSAYERENHESLSPFSAESRTLQEGDAAWKGLPPARGL